MKVVNWLLTPYQSTVDIRLVDINDRLCVVITGVSIEQIEQNPALAKAVKGMIVQLTDKAQQEGFIDDWTVRRDG